MITWKTANRWGWFLTVGTILTTLSLVPIFVEDSSLSWLEWFGSGAVLPMLLFHQRSDAGLIAAGIIGFVVNTFFVAAVIQLGLSWVQYRRRRSVANTQPPAV
jgi:hypothetical protein